MRIAAKGLEIEVRPGTVEDVPSLLAFIRSMAQFEKLEVTATEEILRESLFGEHAAAQTLFVFVEGESVAYAVYFFTFSTMIGKRGLWLDDVYVNPEFRGRGIATALMAYLADVAVQHNCGRFEWSVLDWNESAIAFYQELGATVLDEWRICRLDSSQFSDIAKRLAQVEER
jgi:GNAT superfamily N-acetyltransferase